MRAVSRERFSAVSSVAAMTLLPYCICDVTKPPANFASMERL
jgi:hypothetical protein